jgi:Protein of unknown function (DUF3048) N-terminal domain/Protein of unknown function (DUF3048) C-terminal domain
VRRRTPLIAAVVATLVLVVAACGGGGGDSKKESKEAAVAPFTGLPDRDGESRRRSALEVKVDNAPQGRPQAGLDAADVVFEEVVEGEITRFLAVYNSTLPDTVGPIRSVRVTDANLVWPLGGVFAYSGGAAPSVERIRQAPVNAIDETAGGEAMFRESGRPAPHNLLGRPDGLIAKGGKPVPPRALFQYLADKEQPAGDPASAARIGFAPGFDPTYTYDAQSGTWKRSHGPTPFTARSGAQIAPTNVVVQFMNYEGGPGNPTAEGMTVGEGEVWVFTGGRVVKGRWTRPAKEQPAKYVDAAGKPIKLVPGRTWVHLLPVGSAVDVTAPPPPSTTATTRK